jgi:Ca2+-binding RTX toxin-like protein
MADVTFFVPTDMSASLNFSGFSLSGATSTQITLSNGEDTGVIGGNFTYGGNQVFGTITSIEEFTASTNGLGPTLDAQITGLNIDANTASNDILNNQSQALLQLALGGNNVITGSSGNDTLIDYGGNNVFVPLGGFNVIEGGSGFDQVVINAPIETSTINVSGNQVVVDSSEGQDTITNVQRIQFSDGVLALDIQGDAGNAYRLYQAAFDRTPDVPGLSFWVHQLDLGLNIQTVAQDFVNSAEFQSVYGTNPTNTHIVDLFYQNVLGRLPDAAGLAFWVNQLNAGTQVGAVLEGFAASSENHALVDPTLVTGIHLNSTANLYTA